MSGAQGKLDQSLDAIMKDAKPARTARPRGRVAGRGAIAKTAAPAGGISKKTRAQRAPKVAPVAPAAKATGDSKIIVSQLPLDVNEKLVKDYFGKTIGPIKKLTLAYSATGKSRGEATIVFNKPGHAAAAHQQLNGVPIDGRPMKIELVQSASEVATKSLADRIAKPKTAAQEKNKGAATKGPKAASKATEGTKAATKGKNAKKSGRVGKPKPKTADELDAEMNDYFGGNGETTSAPAPVQDDTNMDEIS